jgi:hypothetical protein
MDSNKFNMNHGERSLNEDKPDQMINSSQHNPDDSNADSKF